LPQWNNLLLTQASISLGKHLTGQAEYAKNDNLSKSIKFFLQVELDFPIQQNTFITSAILAVSAVNKYIKPQ
jgi:hypothetical protein